MNILNNFPSSERSTLKKLATIVRENGGDAWLVGGSPRDALLGVTVKDADVEVFGIPAERLGSLLRSNFPVTEVGSSFGVLKLKGCDIDVSIPRRESKIGTGHKGFIVNSDPYMSIEKACLRRDFTLNALYWNIFDQTLKDPLNGLKDLHSRKLRHCSSQFSEDPLRVLRAMQFSARFECSVCDETIQICKQIEPEDLPPERIYGEWEKLILKGKKPSLGLTFLKECGWLQYFPELEALVGCKQDPEWHPEGDVWSHTLHCMDVFAREKTGNAIEDIIVGLAVLCHDLGKPATTEFTDGRWRSPRHEVEGVEPTLSLLQRMTAERKLLKDIPPLVRYHMTPAIYYKDGAGDNAVRRLAHNVERLDRLVRVASADMQGSPPKQRDLNCLSWLLKKAEELRIRDNRPKPILMGRHLLEMGLKAGPQFKTILNAAFEAQLDGAFTDEEGAKQFIRERLEKDEAP